MTNISLFHRQHGIPSIIGRATLEQVFNQLFDDPFTMVKRSTEGYPLTDLYKDEQDNQVIEVALAGFSRDDLEIEVKDNTINISCSSEARGETNSRRIARRSFSRSFVDYDHQLDMKGADATFENGLLKITIPPTEESKATTISIK